MQQHLVPSGKPDGEQHETTLARLETRLRGEAQRFATRHANEACNTSKDRWLVRCHCDFVPSTRVERKAAKDLIAAKIAAEKRKARRGDPRYSISRHMALAQALEAVDRLAP